MKSDQLHRYRQAEILPLPLPLPLVSPHFKEAESYLLMWRLNTLLLCSDVLSCKVKPGFKLDWKQRQRPDLLFFFFDMRTFLSLSEFSEFHLLCLGGFVRPLGLSVLSGKTSSGQIRSAGFQAAMKGHHFLVTDLPIKVMRQRSAVRCDPAASGGSPAELTSESEVSELTLLSKLLRPVRSEGNFSTSAASVRPRAAAWPPETDSWSHDQLESTEVHYTTLSQKHLVTHNAKQMWGSVTMTLQTETQQINMFINL